MNINDFYPMSPFLGPPLPKSLNIQWPWLKIKVPVVDGNGIPVGEVVVRPAPVVVAIPPAPVVTPYTPPPAPITPGDTIVPSTSVGPVYEARFDMNGDLVIDQRDADEVMALLREFSGKTVAENPRAARVDFDNNGRITILDFGAFSIHMGAIA